MGIILTLKAVLIWLVIAALAVANGIAREKLLVPMLGKDFALPLSGITLSCIVFIVTWLMFGLIGAKSPRTCFWIGGQWVLMTLAFEFLFGHFVVGKPWSVLLQNFNVATGDLFVLVLLVSFLAPYWVARLKGIH